MITKNPKVSELAYTGSGNMCFTAIPQCLLIVEQTLIGGLANSQIYKYSNIHKSARKQVSVAGVNKLSHIHFLLVF